MATLPPRPFLLAQLLPLLGGEELPDLDDRLQFPLLRLGLEGADFRVSGVSSSFSTPCSTLPSMLGRPGGPPYRFAIALAVAIVAVASTTAMTASRLVKEPCIALLLGAWFAVMTRVEMTRVPRTVSSKLAQLPR